MQTLHKLESTIISAFSDYDARPTYEWAPENLVLPESGYARPGKLDLSESRHFIAIYDKLDDEHCREVNYRKPVRCGGTMIADTWIARVLATDPGPCLQLLQTDDDSDDHASERMRPLFDSCPALRAMYPHDRSKLLGNYIEFTNGFIWRITGPAISNLSRFPVRYMHCSELWMWPQGRLNEAKGRLGDYVTLQNHKIFCEAQGGPADGIALEISDWHVQFEDAEIWEWEVQCLGCSRYCDPVFTGTRPDGSLWGIRWEPHKLPSGDWDISRCLPTIRFECPHCGYAHLDGPRTKREWNRYGRYRLTNREGKKKASFHHEATIHFPWEELVDLWLKACNAAHSGDLGPKIQFYQKRRALDMDADTLLRGGIEMKRVAYELDSKWAEEKLRFLHIDCQKNLDTFWWMVRACSGRKTRRLGFGKAYSWAELEAVREKFEIPSYQTTKAARRPWSQVTIDSRYMSKQVFAACCKYGWIAVQGDKKLEFIHEGRNGNRFIRSYDQRKWGDPECPIDGRRDVMAPRIQFSKSRMNGVVKMLIDAGDWEEPIIDPNDPMEQEYARQMGARTRMIIKGKEVWTETEQDHAADLANQHVLEMIVNDLIPDPVEEVKTESEKTI